MSKPLVPGDLIGQFFDSRSTYENISLPFRVADVTTSDALVKLKKVYLGLVYLREACFFFDSAHANVTNRDLHHGAIVEAGILRIAKLFVEGQVQFRKFFEDRLSDGGRETLTRLMKMRHQVIAHSDPKNPFIDCVIGIRSTDAGKCFVSCTSHSIVYDGETESEFHSLATELLDLLTSHRMQLETSILDNLDSGKIEIDLSSDLRYFSEFSSDNIE